MANLPRTTTVVNDTAGALAAGLDNICVIAPVPSNADITPRVFGSAAAVFQQHGFGPGVGYCALHFERTRKPVIFVGLPIDAQGVVGREDTSGNTGTSVTSLSAGANGVLDEHDGILAVSKGGTIGTDQIILGLSLDGGRTTKKVRLGTANSYTVQYFGVTISFGAGTLVDGETIHTWHGSAPRSASSDWAAARAAIASQSKGFRSILLTGDLQNSSEASAFLSQLNALETVNERFIYGRASLYDRAPLATASKTTHRMTGAPNVTFAEVGATGDTITRAAGSFVSDGFAAGDLITVSGSTGNNFTASDPLTAVSATALTLDTDDLVDEGPAGGVTIIAEPSLVFTNSGDTILRQGGSPGSWLDDGFRVGDTVTISGTASNNGSGVITALTDTLMTLDTGDVSADETIRISAVTVATGQTKAAWMAEIDAAFSSIADEFRIDLSAGRGAILCPFSGWVLRRPAGWFASMREYQHDLHITTWRKGDGVLAGATLLDTANNLVEWDDFIDGGAGSLARFTTLRSYVNPAGAFIALSLTRAAEGSLLSYTNNVAVVNLACTTVHLNTENVAIGQSLLLNDDGTATADSLASIAAPVNTALQLALLTDRGEGPRASSAVWTPDPDTLFNVAEPLMVGVLDLQLNGIVHSIRTEVRVR